MIPIYTVHLKEKSMNKKYCFVDSVDWIAILNADDSLHQKADTEFKKRMDSGFHFLTSTAVLNEVANALSRPKFRATVVEFYRRLKSSRRVDIIFVDESLWSAGWELFEDRPDKGWSLTDCISMIIMQRHRIRNAFTNDKHFEQAGFRALLRPTI